MTQSELLARYGRLSWPDHKHNKVNPRSGFYASHDILRNGGIDDCYRPVSRWEHLLFLTWVRLRWFDGPRWGLVMFWPEKESARLMYARFKFRITARLVKRVLTTKQEWFRLEIYDHLTGRLESEKRK